MLTASELASMRATAGAALPDTCTIQTKTYVSDGGGSGTTTWTASGTVNCRLAPIASGRQGEGQTGDRISADAQFIATLPFNAAVTTNSRLLINGGTFNVAAIRDRSWNLSTRAELVKEV